MDCARGSADGVVGAFTSGVVLLIGVQVFHLPDALIALLAAAPFLGNLLALFYSARFSDSRRTKSQLAALPVALVAVLLAQAAIVSGGVAFAVVAGAAGMLFNLRFSFLTAIYRENYERARLGVLFSRGLIASVISGLLANYGFGELLDRGLENYRWVLGCCALTALVSATAIFLMPSSAPDAQGAGNPFRNLTLVKQNRAFGYILMVWFIFGLANLTLLPLKTVYLAEQERGLHLSALTVLLVTGVATSAAQLVSTPLWAAAFDRWNFLVLRMVLNAFLAVSCVLFFATENVWVIALGSALAGICYGGGGIAWNLWVTHYAPARDTHVYMSVHTFLTGVRGVMGPYLGMWALDALGFQSISWIASAMVWLSVLLLAVPAWRGGLRPAPR